MSSSPENVVDFSSFKKKTKLSQEFAHGRKPLFVDQIQGRVSGSESFSASKEADSFASRLQRVRASLEKINQLMSEMKKLSPERKTEKPGETP